MNFDSIILNALREGSSQEDIARIFSQSLNKNAAIIKEEQSKEKEKLKAAEAVANFYNTYYPKILGGYKLTAEDIISASDSLGKISIKTPSFLNEFFEKF